MTTHPLSPAAEQRFADDGFVIIPSVLDTEVCLALTRALQAELDPLLGPVEFEADVGYPGAPANLEAPGGATPRRLLNAFTRSDSLRELALNPQVGSILKRLLNAQSVGMSQCHHNCVMTKHPGYSSATLWHQDMRYWSFDRPELISAWFALGDEVASNGALRVISGTHNHRIDRGRLDKDLFLRPELDDNQVLIERAQTVALNPGDVLLFHCRLFHAAGRNVEDVIKLSPVFTYHALDNRPIPNTRSDRLPSIILGS